MLRLIPALLLLSLTACSPDTMPRYATVQGLRVLGLNLNGTGNVAETSFNGATFNPATLQVTPVLSDLHGGGRQLSFNLYYCLDPGVGLGAPPTCEGNATRVDVSMNTSFGPSGTFTSPEFTGIPTLGLSIDLSTMPPAVLALYSARFTSLTSIQRFNGISILVFFEIFPTLSSSEKITTFKRLFISDGRVLNQNPGTGLDLAREDGTSLVSFPSVETFLKAVVPASNLETYTVQDSSGNPQTLTESIEVAWFLTGPADIECSNDKDCTTDGFLALSRTSPGELNRFTPPKVPLPVGRDRVLIGIVKDNRGGNAVLRVQAL
jgi:hypothetical protein